MLQIARPEFSNQLIHLLKQLDVIALLDIALVAIAIYYLLALSKGTRAMQLLKGLVVLLVISAELRHYQTFQKLSSARRAF